MDKKNTIEIVDRFFQKLTSDEENRFLREWISQPESKEELYQYYSKCWHLASDEMDKGLQNEMMATILSRINISEEGKNKENNYKDISRILPKIAKYAAAACIVFVLALGSFYWGKNSNTPARGELISMTVENGQKADITLSDGTKVYINSASTVTYDNSYNKKDRILTLEGEAYFEVAKNENKPFIVKANGIEVEALGTSFNIKAHKSSPVVAVTLIEGKVKVSDDFNDKYLHPNERLEYSLANRSFATIETLHPNTDHLLWRSRQLAFYGESLEEVCATLTRMYNCEFQFRTDALKKYTYTGIIKNNSLENVLDVISQTTAIKYKIESDNTIVIY